MSAMELSRQGNSRPMSRTPDSSPERSLADENACPRPRSLPYRLKRNPEMETPDSSPEKEQGGVRLSPAKASSNAEIIPTTVLPLLSMERSLRHDAEDASIGSHEAAGKVPVNSPRSSSSDRGLRRRPRTGSARLPPRRLPPGFFPDASRSVSSPPQSAERTPLDGTVYDVPQVVPSPTRQHNSLSATQGSTERGGYIAQGSRNAPSTIQGPAERSGRFSQEPPPPYQRRRLYLHRRPPEQPHRLMPSRETQRRIQQWFRLVSLDISFLFIFLALTGVILLWGGLWRWKERLFPMTFDPHSNTWYGPVEYSYPQHNFIFGITITGIMIPLIPLAVILLTQYWIRSWLDLHAALFALKKAMVMMYVTLRVLDQRF